MSNSKVQKLITFPQELYQLLQGKAAQVGMLVPEYVRFLVLNDVKEFLDDKYYLTEEEEKGVAKSLDDYKKGRYITIKPGDMKKLREVLGVK